MNKSQRAAMFRVLRIGRYLRVTAQHFGLSTAEFNQCWAAATSHPDAALACYRAIARSLVKR